MATRELYDDSRVLFAFRKAPEIFADSIDHWMNKERLTFLGNGATGKGIRGKLLNKTLFADRIGRHGDGKWSPQIVGQFVSYKRNKNKLDLEMTMEFADHSPMKPAMEILETGGTVSSDKFMPIPMYRNLAAAGVTGKFYENFKDMDLTPVKKNGSLYWFYKYGGRMILAFVGKKRIRIHKQFDFHNTWNRRYSSVMQRGQKMMDKATQKVELMIENGDISGL